LDVVLEVVDGEADAAADAGGCEFVVPDQVVDGRPADGEELCRLRTKRSGLRGSNATETSVNV